MAEQDTALQAGQSRFPQTAWSVLARLKDPKDPQVRAFLDRMVQAYWRPVYKFIRISWKHSNEDAKDLTQAFFVHLLEGDLLQRADPGRGNFRHFLMASVRNFLANDARAGKALKRGGGVDIIALGSDVDESWIPQGARPEEIFEAQWARDVLGRAIEKLGTSIRPEAFAAFRRFHMEEASVKTIAGELGVSESQVGHLLHAARVDLRRLVTDEIRAYVHDETELAQELDALFKSWQ
jgi:RNA polymerase sigma factor (sigma-70 family)